MTLSVSLPANGTYPADGPAVLGFPSCPTRCAILSDREGHLDGGKKRHV
jgi:hypothetical protein